MNELQITPTAFFVEMNFGSPNLVRTPVLMAVTVIGINLCYRMALPFRSALALALAVLFATFHRWVEARLNLHFLLASMSVVGSLLLLGPAGLIPGAVALTITSVLFEIRTSRARERRYAGQV